MAHLGFSHTANVDSVIVLKQWVQLDTTHSNLGGRGVKVHSWKVYNELPLIRPPLGHQGQSKVARLEGWPNQQATIIFRGARF